MAQSEKKRYINTSFWTDQYILKLSEKEKYFYMFLLTNPQTNIGGVYELAEDLIIFLTKLKRNEIKSFFQRFSKDGKIYYLDGWVYIRNFAKHQSQSEKIKKGISNVFAEVPSEVMAKIKSIDSGVQEVEKPIKTASEELQEEIAAYDKIPFETFWEAYEKKIGRPKSEEKWNRLKKSEQEEILEYIPKYLKFQPNPKYRKNPETFFNNRAWEDEIPEEETAKPQKYDRETEERIQATLARKKIDSLPVQGTQQRETVQVNTMPLLNKFKIR